MNIPLPYEPVIVWVSVVNPCIIIIIFRVKARALNIVVVGVIVMIEMVRMSFARHFRRSYGALDARNGFQDPPQGLRTDGVAAPRGQSVLHGVFNSHVVGAFALGTTGLIIHVVVDDVEKIGILKLELGIIGGLGVLKRMVYFAVMPILQYVTGLNAFRALKVLLAVGQA